MTDRYKYFETADSYFNDLVGRYPEIADMPVGTKVWYRQRGGGIKPGTIVGHGEKNEQAVYDVKVENAPDDQSMYWGYIDQFQKKGET